MSSNFMHSFFSNCEIPSNYLFLKSSKGIRTLVLAAFIAVAAVSKEVENNNFEARSRVRPDQRTEAK